MITIGRYLVNLFSKLKGRQACVPMSPSYRQVFTALKYYRRTGERTGHPRARINFTEKQTAAYTFVLGSSGRPSLSGHAAACPIIYRRSDASTT